MANYFLDKKIGIIGGGQLGQMMLLEAKKMGFYAVVLDPAEDCPCHSICDEHIAADFDDEDAFRLLAEKTDVITYEFEHINAKALERLESKGCKVYPSAASLEIIQDKLTQKKAMLNADLPVPEFMPIESIDDMASAGKKYGYPYMLKARTGGYDGKGNAVVKTADTLEEAYKELGGGKIKLMAEKMVDFKMETSILACRSLNGDIAVYPVGDNEHIDSILHKTSVPANIPGKAAKTAMKAASKVMEIFDGIGMFCVEMFVTNNNDILVNEVAPRPHNSGHYTIEGCITSQFENHIRAVAGLPLGDTSLISPTVMINLLGEEGFSGNALVEGLDKAMALKGVTVHIYGKKQTKPKRKMGHITVTANSVAKANAIAEEAFGYIKIKS
ncbi:MAG: 5-(carboxyamino)imidazole ribonucleotide synthase [Clostridia bacterium]|nr:5-(carboxyamino)imidazole ribonucleotide synthase [Clostridia bacterium]